MTTTTVTAQDRTAADTSAAPLVYRPLDPAWGDADALAELRAIRAARTRGYDRDLAMAQTALRAERTRRTDHGRRPAAGSRTRRRHGQHRGDGLRLFGHRFA